MWSFYIFKTHPSQGLNESERRTLLVGNMEK